MPLTTLGVGEIFGEMAVIDGSPRSASAVAVEPCELVVVSSEAISERIDSADPIVRLLISMLLKRMRFTNQSAKRLGDEESPAQLLAVDLVEADSISLQTAQALEKMRLESELKHALNEGQFALHYQPIVHLHNGYIAGFEALIRWSSSDRGLVRPDIFMGIAEETSLIVPIGKWVIEEACKALAAFDKQYGQSPECQKLFLSINISGRQFHDSNFFNHLLESVKEFDVDCRQLKLEVTERIFMEGPAAIHAIKKCRSLGFPVALDDFGTGFSSLSYLAQFEVDNLKVDQSFVRRMINDERTRVITQAIVAMANGLKVPVIAEGIETKEDHMALLDMDCCLGQGYLFSRPVPFDAAMALLKSSKSLA